MKLAPTLGTVTIDSANAPALAAWYAQILGGNVDVFADVGIHVVRAEALRGMNLAIAQVSRPTPGKNRIHLDFGAANRAATVAFLIDRGAAKIEEHEYEGLGWSVLADPDGNRFCVSDEAAAS